MLATALLLPLIASAAEPPQLQLHWRRTALALEVVPPPGHHLAADAPLGLRIELDGSLHELQTQSSAVEDLVLSIPAARPLALDGQLQVGLCADRSTSCRVETFELQAILLRQRGRQAVSLRRPPPAPPRRATQDLPDLLRGAESERSLLLFTATWCPSCTLLASQLVNDPQDAHLFDGLTVIEVDVDDHHSWSALARYQIRAYPSLVLVDRSGAEISRLTGYPSEASARTWLRSAPDQAPLLAAPAPETLSPAAAAEWARRLVESERTDLAGPYLRQARQPGPPLIDLRIAMYRLRPSPGLALELADRGVPVLEWAWSALPFVDRSAELSARIAAEARAALDGASPAETVDLMGLIAATAPPKEAAERHRATALARRALLTGDLDQDRGHLVPLARDWERAGEPAEAAAVLDAAIARWPTAMGFHEARAALALRRGELELAVAEAELAVSLGHGDNQLRATLLLARALHAVDKTDEAVALVEKTLARNQAPAAELQVSTHRHLAALRSLDFLPEPP